MKKYDDNTHSEIIEMECFRRLDELSKAPPKDALFIFDIDEVLIHARDQVLRPPHKAKWLYDQIDSRYSPEEAKHLSGYIWSDYLVQLVDQDIPRIISALSLAGARPIALTAGWNGDLGNTENHCDLRIDILKNYGIDFSKSFQQSDEIFLEEFSLCGKIPSFKQGVIFACMLPKHEILDAFLKKVKFIPEQIHFIDDSLPNLIGMRDYCARKQIGYLGYHYVGVEKRELVPLDNTRAKLQYDVVLREKMWLSDEEADQILKSTRQKTVLK